jgi:Domain of unknown function (DUF202)
VSAPRGQRPGGPGDRDPGLAAHRTSLAWTRTTLAFAAIGAVVVRRDLITGLIVLALSVVVGVCGRLGRPSGDGRARPWPLLVIALAVTGVSLAALGITLFGPPSAGLRP